VVEKKDFVSAHSAPVGTGSQVEERIQKARLLEKGLDGEGVALVIADTGIDLDFLRHKLGREIPMETRLDGILVEPYLCAPGRWPRGHGTACAFDALIAAPRATLVDLPILRAPATHPLSLFSGTVETACSAFRAVLSSRKQGALKDFKAVVVSNSWGMYHPSWDFPEGHPDRYCDNPDHPLHRLAAELSDVGIDLVFAARNCGVPSPFEKCQARTEGSIMGTAASRDVLTVAACDLNLVRAGYSSEGPSIAGMYSRKPDVASFSHLLGSELFGPGIADRGTSTACSLAAGCVAALRSSELCSPKTVPTPTLFEVIRKSAHPISEKNGDWNPQTGFGVLDPAAAAAALGI